MDVFADTSAFYALADRSDAYHDMALDYFSEACLRDRFFTSEYVLVETWGLLRNKLGKNAANVFWDYILSGTVLLIGVSMEDLIAARKVSKRYPDQGFSLVDCVSFHLMDRYEILSAFAFDRHFRLVRMRRKSFNVVP